MKLYQYPCPRIWELRHYLHLVPVFVSVSPFFYPTKKRKGFFPPIFLSLIGLLTEYSLSLSLSHVILAMNKLQLEDIFLFIQGSLKILSLCLNFQIELIIFFKVDD